MRILQVRIRDRLDFEQGVQAACIKGVYRGKAVPWILGTVQAEDKMKFPNDLIIRKDVIDILNWWIEAYPEYASYFRGIIEDVEHLEGAAEE